MKFTLIALAMAFSAQAFSANQGTLVLKGNIGAILDIQVNAETVANQLDLTQNQADLLVGKTIESSNSSSGYKVTVTSQNLGKLTHATSTDEVPYTLKYNDISVDLVNGSTKTYPSAIYSQVPRDVKISYTGVQADSVASGDYTDTVTFTIAAQ